MKALFAHDNVFVQGSNAIYSEGQFGYSAWTRYLYFFDHLTVVGRVRGLENNEQIEYLNTASGPNISFIFVPNLASPKAMMINRLQAMRILTEAVAGVDAVIARLPSETGILATKIAQRLKKLWAVEVVGCAWTSFWNYGDWRGKLYALPVMLRTRAVVMKSPFVIYVTRQFLQRRYPSHGRVAVASNVQIPPLDPAVLTNRLSRQCGIDAPLIFGLIGSLKAKYKGIQTALAAFACVRDRLPPFEFCILGNGPIQSWQAMAESHGLSDCVHFCGMLPSGDRVLEWLDQIDIYLQPSLTEGLPRTLIEAMSRGCPALGSTAGGIPELLSPECMHRPGDERQLSELIIRAVQDADWRNRQARRNFEVAKEYASDVLDTHRMVFWKTFSDAVLGYSERI